MWVRCPYCSKRYYFKRDDEEQMKAFPFCSRRCKLLDLGAWLDAKYRIPGETEGTVKEGKNG